MVGFALYESDVREVIPEGPDAIPPMLTARLIRLRVKLGNRVWGSPVVTGETNEAMRQWRYRQIAIARVGQSLCALIALFSLGIVSSTLAQDPANETPPSGPAVDPAHRIAFDDAPDIRSVAFSPDDSQVFVHAIVPYLDAWDAAVFFWPEILGSISVILIAILAIRMFQVRRRPRTAGLRYCRQCNYCLEGIDLTKEQRCPECGVTLDARRGVALGRSLWQRMSVPSVLFVMANLPLAFLIAGKTSRDSALLQGWLDVPTRRFVRPIMQSPMWASLSQATIRSGDLVRSIDPRTGQTIRTVCMRGRDTRWTMAMSPSGDSIFLGGMDGPTSITRIDAETGEETASIDTGLVATLPQMRHVIYVSPDGHDVYIAGSTADLSTSIRRWNWYTGELQTIFEEPSPHAVDWTGEIQIVAIPDSPLPRFAIGISDPQSSRAFRVRVLGVGGELQQQRSFATASMLDLWRIRPMTERGSPVLVLSQPGGRHRITWNLVTGGETLVENDVIPFGPDHWDLSSDGSLLVVPPKDGGDVSVFASHLTEPICVLSIPSDVFGPMPTISRTGRWIAITALRDLTPSEILATGERYGHDVMLYDISTVDPLAAH